VAKQKVNKSRMILDYCAENPSAKPREVAAVLNKTKNLGISPQYVSTIKNKAKTGNTKKGASLVDLGALIEAKKFVDRVGGLKAAEDALTAIAQINA
jgi:hypothetical protein